MGYLDYAGLQYLWGKLKEKFAPKSHSHDDRYYTESEMDGKLSGKADNTRAGANDLINKLDSGTAAPVDDDLIITQWANHTTAAAANKNHYVRRPMSSIWNYIKGKTDGVYQPKGSYAASGHTHDDRYYTETEMNAKLDGKSNTGHTHDDRYYTESEIDSKLSGKANSNHSHYSITTVADNRNTNTTPNDYRNTFIFQGLKDNSKINSPSSDTYSYLLGLRGWNDSSGGNSHELAFNNTGVYWRNGSTEWNGWNRLYTENYHPNADHASSADYATNAGSANGVAPEWSGSVDLNSSSWLAAWSSDGKKIKAMSTGTFAKASHTHTKAQVGLSNVDNTADANKSVKYATSSGTADSATTSNGVKDYNDANRTIKIGFAGDGLNTSNLNYIAGYADNGTKIKDVSKDVLKSWIGLGNYLPLVGGTMSGALNFANGTWNAVGDDVQIGDHDTSGSFYIQGLNGPTNIKLKKKGDTSTGAGDSATITYDGGNLIIDKTIQANLSGNASTATKAVSADKATSASSADKAAKLTTARTVSGGSDITLSFNYDGSGNSTANIGFYSCKHSIGNTNNYPFHRFAKLDANKNAWVDNSMTFLISQDYSGGGYGICRLVYRSNADSSSASLAAEWLVRKGLSVDTVQVAIKTDKTNGAYCDAFYKSSGGYMSVVIRAIASGGRASLGRTWTLINSNETDGTTATDKKTSSECWKTIADAGNELHKQAYSSSASAIDGGYVASAGSANSASTCTGNSASATKLTSSAGSATQPVYFKDGKPVAGTYTLGDASSKMVRTLSAQGNSGWTNKTTDDKYVPTMSFMAYWNGAYGGTYSNLQYCDRGRFGTIVTKGSGDYAAASHTHNYAGSGSAGGSANSAIKLDSSAGSAIQPVYFKDGKPVATTYTLNKTVPADAKFTDTNTWRGIQNNLTSDSTDQSLSAAQGKALKTLVDGKAPASHKHTKSQITDFPTSMPASDVSAWAKAATKPSYTKAEVGLSNVDNTADKDKSVKYATSAGLATNAQCLNNDDKYMKFHWSGQKGQPTWLWGGNDSGDMYVYNPSNFNVNYANSAGSATIAWNGVETSGSNYIRFKCGVQICWKANVAIDAYGSTYTFQAAFSAIPAITAIGCQDLDDVFFIRNITKTNFIGDKKGYLNGNVSWIAVGVWK